jgi:formate hydrogenlyase subunit 3/multisubunit Na+/H+ antiporter MnhD subunit
MSKDQAIGGAILVVCVLVAVFYVVTLFYPSWLTVLGVSQAAVAWHGDVQFWLVAVPVFIAFVAILLIGAWIGWTMATTPPPKPIEEITTEMEEKKEEIKPEETAAPEPAPAASPAPEKKKKEK